MQVVFTSSTFQTARNGWIDLSEMPSWARAELRLQEVILQTLQWFDAGSNSTSSNWKPAMVRWLENGSSCILMRAHVPGSFPCKFVVDMADGLDAAVATHNIQPVYNAQQLFAASFPGLHIGNIDEFVAAVLIWSDIPMTDRDMYRQAGRSQSGSWAKVIKAAQSSTP